MAHEISTVNGVAEAAFAFKPAWHGLGQVLPTTMTWAEAAVAAHLEWDVLQGPAYMGLPERVVPTNDGPMTIPAKVVEVPGDRYNYRSDTLAPLGHVSDGYTCFQNREMFKFLDGAVASGDLRYESAGALNGGRRIWLLARMPGCDTVLPGDDNLRYVLLTSAHDGTGSIRMLATSIRVVCSNTLAMATNRRKGTTIQLRHTSGLPEQLAKAKEVLKSANSQFDNFAELARRMAKVKVTRAQVETMLATIYPDPKEPEAKRSKARVERIRADILRTFREDVPAQVAEADGTVWGALNAVTQVEDRMDRRGATPLAKKEAAFNSSLLGASAETKSLALRAFAGLVSPDAFAMATDLTVSA